MLIIFFFYFNNKNFLCRRI